MASISITPDQLINSLLIDRELPYFLAKDATELHVAIPFTDKFVTFTGEFKFMSENAIKRFIDGEKREYARKAM